MSLRPKLVLVLLTAIAVVLGLASTAQAAPQAGQPSTGAPSSGTGDGGGSAVRPTDTVAAKARARALAAITPDATSTVVEGAYDKATTATIEHNTPTQLVAAPAAAAGAAAGSTLTALSLSARTFGGFAPGFDAAVHDYEAVMWDDSTLAVSPTAVDGARVVVSEAGTTYDLTAGTATVPITMGRNDVKIAVTAGDDSSTTTYTVHVWSVASPASKIVSVSDAQTSKFGGGFMSVVLSDGALPPGCGRMYWVNGQSTYPRNLTYDPNTNLATDEVYLPELPGRLTGTFDLREQTSCNVWNSYWYYGSSFSAATRPAAVKYVDSFTIDDVTAPNPVTSGSRFVATGKDFNAYSDIRYWLSDDQGNTESDLWWWNATGNGNLDFILDYPWGEDFFKGAAGPRTLHIGYCPQYHGWQIDSACTSVYSKTVNWTPPTPRNVSFTPASGPVTGGTLVKMKGRFLASGTNELHVYVGGHEVDGLEITSRGAWNARTYDEYATAMDQLQFRIPAGLPAGTYPVTVTTEIGTGTARGTFTLSGKPSIDAIAPSTVANTGGSVITVTGSNFGTAGTPTVIVNGTKAPYVKRANAGKLLAVVPAAAGVTGPVDVSVGSPQGGGVSDPATLTLAAAGSAPTVTAITPASAHASDTVTLTGSGFATTGTAVAVDGNWVLPDSVTSTSISITVPGTDTAGAKDVVVATPTGSVTKAGGLTVLADAGISVVTPNSVPSYATGSASRITIDGAGFGSGGTVKVGTAAAVAYTASAGGTHIANVAVPTTAAGLLPIVVTPTGSATPLRGNVTVTAPNLTYVGSDPYADRYADIDADSYRALGHVIEAPLAGGTPMRLQGTGFGPSGQVTVGGATVSTTSWTDTAITFKAPAHAAGTVAVTVKPGGTITATRSSGIVYASAPPAPPTLAKVETVVDNQRPRNYFDPVNDLDNRVTVTGADLTGSSASATRVTLTAGAETTTIVPTAVTATSLTFAAPRSLAGGWKNLTVTTDVGSIQSAYGVYYMSAGVTIGASPWSGLCQRHPVAATGDVTYQPATTTISASSANVFGTAGTVTIDGIAVTPTSYADQQIVLPMTGLASDLTNPWGWKGIVVTPSDANLPAQTVGFYCGVSPSVTTTVNGGTDALTVAAGTSFTLGYSTSGFIGANPFSATAPSGYEYVTDADYRSTGFNGNVRSGVPAAAGDYWVRVALGQATYDRAPYFGFAPSAVHVTITGLPLTVTPVSKNGASFTYKGQLGDGTDGTSLDFAYTASPNAPTGADAITKVDYQYRDSACENAAAGSYWIDGLPKNVARSASYCGGDGTTRSSWDVRVKSITMNSSGTDRSIFYATTFPTIRITITSRNVAVATVRADKVYDGTTVAPLGEIGFTGAIDGDDLGLDNAASGGTFADAVPGANKEVTLNAALSLSGGDRGDYVLTNPNPTVVGTISKAPAVLSLDTSSSSILLSQTPTATITAVSRNPLTGQPVDNTAAAVALSSQTPRVCTISGTTVTGIAAGTCTIAGSQPASVDYLAAKAASDETTTVETIELQVFAAPRTISVVADDLTVGVGDDISPTYQVSGLFDGDSVDGVEFEYYSGATHLDAAPTTPGTYRIVPTGGTLTAASDEAYTNPTSFGYVAGKLVVTNPPPTIDSIDPLSGPTTGGTKITITGTRLDTVKAVHIGSVTLKRGDFAVNADGTVLTFVSPKVSEGGGVSLELAAGAATAQDVFTYVAPNHPKPPAKHAPGAPRLIGVHGGDRSITVTFARPASAGSSPIRSYEVSTDGGRTWHVVAVQAGPNGTLVVVARGLANGRHYAVQLRARSAAGVGRNVHSATVLVNAAWRRVRTTSGLLPVPAHPKAYHGPLRRTAAAYRDARGRVAHPTSDIGHRQLLKGDCITTLGDEVFHFDKATITAKGWRVLRKLAAHLAYAHALRIEGYTDYAGRASHELRLSRQRALAIAHALAKLGVKVTFSTDGYGGSRPVVVGGTAGQRAANRRVVVDVVR